MTSPSKSLFFHRYRFFILALAWLCLTSLNSNYLTFNFAVICMSPSLNETDQRDNDFPTYSYTQYDKTLLNWALGIGSILATFPFNWLYTNYGARYVFTFAGVVSTLSTLVIPQAAEFGLWFFVVARFFQGVAYAGNFAVIGVIVTIWAPIKEIATFLAFMTCFTPLSPLITNPISGIICETLGWPYVYYSHAGACAILFTLWYLCYQDKPENHKLVSLKEIELIHQDKKAEHKQIDSYVPYWEIIKNPLILATWLSALANFGCIIFIILYSPTYFRNVLKFKITHSGFLSAIPSILNIVGKVISGYASDKIQINERFKMIVGNSIALIPPSILFFILGYIEDPMTSFWLTVTMQFILGMNCGGFYKCATLISKQYSHFVISIIQFMKCLVLLAAPGLMSIFVVDDTSREQWKNVFFVLGIFLIISNLLFCFLVNDKPASFTKITKHKESYIQVPQESDKNGI